MQSGCKLLPFQLRSLHFQLMIPLLSVLRILYYALFNSVNEPETTKVLQKIKKQNLYSLAGCTKKFVNVSEVCPTTLYTCFACSRRTKNLIFLAWPDSMKGLNTKINPLHADTITARHAHPQEVSSVLPSDRPTGWGKVHGGAHPPGLPCQSASGAATTGDCHMSPEILSC